MIETGEIATFESDLSVRFLANRSMLTIKGAKDADCRRGPALDGLAIDEAQDFDGNDYHAIFRPLLTGKNGCAIIGGTKKRDSWFNKEWLAVERGELKESKAFWFPSWTNPTVKSDEWNNIKDSLIKIGRRGTWEDEYAADPHDISSGDSNFKYPEFNRFIHFIQPFPIPENFKRYRGMDWGISHATTCLWAAVSPEGIIYIYDEFSVKNQTIESAANLINRKTGNSKIEFTVLDPACWHRESDGLSPERRFLQHGIRCIKGDKEDKYDSGSSDVRSFFKPAEGKPKLFIFSNCTQLADQLEKLTWTTKFNDDLVDALRYLVVAVKRVIPGKIIEDDWYDTTRFLRQEDGSYVHIIPQENDDVKFTEEGFVA